MSRSITSLTRRVRGRQAAAAGLALVIAGAGVAHAADSRYVSHSLVEAAAPGLTVTGPLKEFHAVNGARIIVPTSWRSLSAKAGQRRYLSAQNSSCHYRVTFTAKSRLGAPADPVAYVNAALPAQSARYLLDSGLHGSRAFRVVRKQTSGATVRVDALFATVLTRRADIAPAGQVAWAEIRVSATSSAGDECHSGTYREALGPQIGDMLATARVRLRFVKP